MVVGLVFIYLAILLYGAVLLLLACLTIYASYHFQRRTTHALLGLLGWLLAAPILGFVVFLVLDTAELWPLLGVGVDGPRFESFELSILFVYMGCSPLFLVPLVRRLLPTRGRAAQPA